MNKAVVGVIGLVIIAVVVGGGLYLKQNIDGVVKGLIEEAGTEATGTQVKVGAVKLNLTEGAGVISGLSVANPQGFSQASLFTMDSIKVDIDTASLTEDVYIIENIAIDGARVLAEQVGGGTNIQALLNGMEAIEDSAGDSASENASEEPRLAVKQISFTSGNVQLMSDVFGDRTLSIPDFTLNDLGSSEGGLTPEELSTEIAGELLGQVKDAVMDEISDLAKEAARAKLKEKIGEKAAEGLNKLKGLFNKED